MADVERNDLLLQALAKVALLEYLVRTILREQAISSGKTAEEIQRWAEGQKQCFEASLPADAGLYMTAVADAFFTTLASDLGAAPRRR